MSESANHEAWRNAVQAFSKAMDEAKSVVDQTRGATGSPLQKFLLAQLQDAYRTGFSIQILAQQGLVDRRVPADSVEVLARQIVERMIVSSYARKHHSADIVHRWRKTSALEWKRSYGYSVDEEAESLPVQCLPDFTAMAKDVGAEVDDAFKAWRRFSWVSHARGAQPYTVVESIRSHKGMSSKHFFCKRVQEALQVTSAALNILTRNFSDSQRAE